MSLDYEDPSSNLPANVASTGAWLVAGVAAVTVLGALLRQREEARQRELEVQTARAALVGAKILVIGGLGLCALNIVLEHWLLLTFLAIAAVSVAGAAQERRTQQLQRDRELRACELEARAQQAFGRSRRDRNRARDLLREAARIRNDSQDWPS